MISSKIHRATRCGSSRCMTGSNGATDSSRPRRSLDGDSGHFPSGSDLANGISRSISMGCGRRPLRFPFAIELNRFSQTMNAIDGLGRYGSPNSTGTAPFGKVPDHFEHRSPQANCRTISLASASNRWMGSLEFCIPCRHGDLFAAFLRWGCFALGPLYDWGNPPPLQASTQGESLR